VVPRESVIAPNQQLTPGEGLILHTITHARNIDELSLVASHWNSDTASACWISGSQTQARCAGLCRSITFDDCARENDTQEVEHLGIQRGRTRGDEFELSTEQLPNLGHPKSAPKCGDRETAHLLEYEAVPDRMGIDAGGFESLELSVDRSPEQGTLETWGAGGGHDGLVYLVQQSGDRWEEIRLQDPQIFDNSKRRTGVVADSTSPSQDDQFDGSLRCNHAFSDTGKSLKGGPNITS